MLSTPRRLAFVALVAVVGTLLPTATAAACSCMRGSIEDRVSGADAVFEARFAGMEGGLATMAITRVWKGMPDDVESVRLAGVGPNSAGCEVAMEAGEVYVVFASREDDALRTNACFGTARVDDVPDVLAVLGPGFVPVDPDVPPGPDVASMAGDEPRVVPPEDDSTGESPGEAARTPAGGGCAHCAAAEGRPGAALGALLLGLVALRPLRRSP